MLINKKLFHLFYFFKQSINIKKHYNLDLFYLVLKKKNSITLYVALYFLNLFLKKKIINYYYNYKLKIVIPSKLIFDSILLMLFNYIKSKYFFKFKITHNFIAKTKKKYTILRSPFIYKKSQESFLIEYFLGIINLRLQKKNIYIKRNKKSKELNKKFFVKIKHFEYLLLNKFTNNWLYSKILLTRFFFPL